LYANRSLQLPHTDPDARDMMLSCGATLNHCQIAFAALGWQATIRRFPNPEVADHVAAIELHRHAATELDIALAAAIPRRRTDRRRYSPWHVAPGTIGVIGSRTTRMGVLFRRVGDVPGLSEIVAEAARRHAVDHGYSTELATWSGHYGSTAGVPARNTPKPDVDAPIPARWFAGPALAQPRGSEATSDNAVVVALGTSDDSELSRLRAGEATSLVLLSATAAGLASCPITEPLELPETRARVRDHVFGGDSAPQMLIRIGWAPVNADPLPVTPRRNLHEVFVRLDGSPIR
jgi:nitroreductase